MPSLTLASDLTLQPTLLPPGEIDALYVHIPFCFHKCHYCDFYSITRQGDERMSLFVDRILHEAEMWTALGPRISLKPRTVFFGGGTPTLLPIEQMNRLLAGLRDRIDLSAVDEWTVEANPATVDADYCHALHAGGVDRMSFGAQSFDREELKLLERHHDPDDVPRSLDLARSAGVRRLNLDLIFAIPGQTMVSWQRSLDAAIALGTSHLSCYALTYEPNTAMAVRRRLGHFEPAEEALELEMLDQTRRKLRDIGIGPYEISNFAANGQECRHNLNYWTGGNYVGLGPSAASHVRGWRWKNRAHLREWEQAIDRAVLPAGEVEHLTPRQRAGELAMLMLRLERGLNFSDFIARAAIDARTLYADVIGRFTAAGLLLDAGNAIRLTDRGIHVADALAVEFLSAAS